MKKLLKQIKESSATNEEYRAYLKESGLISIPETEVLEFTVDLDSIESYKNLIEYFDSVNIPIGSTEGNNYKAYQLPVEYDHRIILLSCHDNICVMVFRPTMTSSDEMRLHIGNWIKVAADVSSLRSY